MVGFSFRGEFMAIFQFHFLLLFFCFVLSLNFQNKLSFPVASQWYLSEKGDAARISNLSFFSKFVGLGFVWSMAIFKLFFLPYLLTPILKSKSNS